MSNFGRLFRFEIRKILCRKLTIIVLTGVVMLFVGADIAECVAAKRAPSCNDDSIVGRSLDDSLFEEMRAGIKPEIMTDSLGNEEIKSVAFENDAYRHLFDYLLNCFGNYTRAYNATEAQLSKTFHEIIDHAYEEDKLSAEEIAYWEARRSDLVIPPVYDKSGGWSNSIINLYMANFFMLIAIGTTMSGVFADEYGRRTDAIIFASKVGKKKLSLIKILAGCSVGLIEAIIILAANVVVLFVLYGGSDANASIALVYGPTLMSMSARKAFMICIGILLILSLFYSLFSMFISQLFKNTTAPVALLAVLLICSMFNPPHQYRLISQIAAYMPATFPGSWTFADYRLLCIPGCKLNILQVLPVLYGVLVLLLGFFTYRSYGRTQIKGR